MNSLKNLEESMGCNTIRDDHGGGIIYQRVHMDKAEFDEMLRKVEEEYSGLQAENAKLVDVLHEVETEAVYAYRCLQQDCATATNSSEHFFKKWWHAECELDQAKAENAKLRELLQRTWDIFHDATAREFNDTKNELRELGVEVD